MGDVAVIFTCKNFHENLVYKVAIYFKIRYNVI